MHADNANTWASDVRLVIITQLAYVTSFETGLRHLERTKTGCNGEQQAHSGTLASTCFNSN
jgi:hypothetical protein